MGITLPTGYTMTTTFIEDFGVANVFGDDAIRDTFELAFRYWKDNPVYLAELAIATNMNCWHWYREGNKERSRLYQDLYYKCQNHAYSDDNGWSEEDVNTYWRITD